LLPYPWVILAVLFKARHAVRAAKGMALASCMVTVIEKKNSIKQNFNTRITLERENGKINRYVQFSDNQTILSARTGQ